MTGSAGGAAGTGSAGGAGGIPRLRVVREAARDELPGWDARTVAAPGGDVQQSVAWGQHRERTGWEAHHLVLDDGSAVLALGRRWRLLGGGRLYIPKGPIAGGAGAEVVAGRLAAVATWAREAGFDVIVADPEIPAATGFPALVAGVGFHPVEEVGPSRHRMAVPIAPGASDRDLLAPIATTTRQRFLSAARRGIRIVRYDRLAGDHEIPGLEVPAGSLDDAAPEAFARFHALLQATGERRGFSVGTRPAALAWWRAALDAGHLLLLEALAPDGTLLGGAVFFRHGGRLTYSHSGDVAELRGAHPGAMGLLLWRALQLASREGHNELDLGGVDVRGARREPLPGEPMYGLLTFKRSFGGQWLELSGAQERVLRRPQHALAAGARKASAAVRRAAGIVRRPAGGPP